MKTLQISSIPMLEHAQEAYEALVIQITTMLPTIFNVKKRSAMIEKRKKAMEMVDHIILVINEIKSEASNPKS